jgi:hypothetical protein
MQVKGPVGQCKVDMRALEVLQCGLKAPKKQLITSFLRPDFG